MPEWDSEVEVEEDLARHLIATSFPSLDVSTLERVGEGWDNTVWATADGIAFRFPRRQIAVPGVEREVAVLPELAAQLPAPIPDAAYSSAPGPDFPWPWFGSRLIPGAEVAAAGLTAERRHRLAADLGRFLGRLHSVRPPTAVRLPRDPMGRGDMATRIPRTTQALARLAPPWSGMARAEELLRAAEDLPPDDEVVVVHGDLNLRHALVSRSGGLAGVIDWGDVCLAPRSVDLPLYWSLFDTDGRQAFRDAYGSVSDSTLARARVLGLFFDATLAAYALQKEMGALAREALDGLGRTVTD